MPTNKGYPPQEIVEQTRYLIHHDAIHSIHGTLNPMA